MAFADIYRGKRVLVTGHTGFKGSWLCEWLLALGADVTGLALPPLPQPALFDQLGLAGRMRHLEGDIRDSDLVGRVVAEARPEFVFHLAAQPLVRLSYEQPVETYATNVMGTVHVLDAVRLAGRTCSVVAVTTDKCYENKEWVHSYREEDPMGGYDPYSSSKGAAELVIAAYRRSFFSELQRAKGRAPDVRLASARAGNVIGGGDWALDRIVPDCVRALQRGEAIPVRNKVATRPWQHVLEPLSGYLWLGAVLSNPQVSGIPAAAQAARLVPGGQQAATGSSQVSHFTSAFNFGPTLSSNRTVKELVEEFLRHWPGRWEDRSDPLAVHEAKLLNLATDKAHHFLGWQQVWDFPRTLAETAAWYRSATSGAIDMRALTRAQIEGYVRAATTLKLSWAK